MFHKKVCENLNKKNQAMYDIDNQEDTTTDALLIYAPKKAKMTSLDSMYSEQVNKEVYKKKIDKKWLYIGFAGIAGVVAVVVTVIILGVL